METPNTPEKVSRDKVLEAYRKLSEKGIMNPGSLDEMAPDVQKAQELEDAWSRELAKEPDHHRVNFEHTTLMLDAGFTSPEYARDVREYLSLDLDDLEETSESDQRLKQEIEAKIAQIDKLLDSQ